MNSGPSAGNLMTPFRNNFKSDAGVGQCPAQSHVCIRWICSNGRLVLCMWESQRDEGAFLIQMGWLELTIVLWNLCPWLSSRLLEKPLALSSNPGALTRCGALRDSLDLSDPIFSDPEMNVLNPCPLCQIISGVKVKKNGCKSLDKTREILSLLLD